MKIYQLFWTMMKKFKIFILFFLISNTVFSQYSEISVIPQDRNSLIFSIENISNKNFGIYFGGVCEIGVTSSPYIYRTPYTYFNRIGISYGILKCGVVFCYGIKSDPQSGPYPIFYQNFILKIHPIKLFSGKKNIWDISLIYDFSDSNYQGFGICIPINNDY